MGTRIVNRTRANAIVPDLKGKKRVRHALGEISEFSFSTIESSSAAKTGNDIIFTAAYPEPANWNGLDYRAALDDTRPVRKWSFDGGEEPPAIGTTERRTGNATRFPDAARPLPGWPGREPGSTAWSWGAWLRADRAPQDTVSAPERYFPVLLHGADNTSGQEIGYHVGGAAAGALVIHLGTGDPPAGRTEPCRWKWHGRPANLDYRVRGDNNNILLYQGGEPLNVHRGIVGDRAGSLVGDDVFEWEESPANIRAHLSKSVLGAVPPASLFIEVTTDIPDHSLYSETKIDRTPVNDAPTTYGYLRAAGEPGILSTPPSVVVGQPFAVAFYLDTQKTKPFRIDAEPEYEASAAFPADGDADREVSRVVFLGNGTLQISFDSPLPAADVANGALLLAVTGEIWGGAVTDAGDGHYTTALGAQVYGVVRNLLEKGNEARIRFIRTDAATIDEANWTYEPTGEMPDAWRLTLRGPKAGGGPPAIARVDAPVQRDGVWHYIHFSADATALKAFVDGVEVGMVSNRYQGSLWNNPTPSITGAVRAFVSGRPGQDGSSPGTGITGALLATGSGRFPSIPIIDTDGTIKHIRQLAIRYSEADRVGIELSSVAGAVDTPVALTADAIAHYAVFIRVTQADGATRHVIQSQAAAVWQRVPPDAGDYFIVTTDDNDTNNWFQGTTGLTFDIAIVDTRPQYGFNRDETTVPGGHDDTVLAHDWNDDVDAATPFWSPRVTADYIGGASPLRMRSNLSAAEIRAQAPYPHGIELLPAGGATLYFPNGTEQAIEFIRMGSSILTMHFQSGASALLAARATNGLNNYRLVIVTNRLTNNTNIKELLFSASGAGGLTLQWHVADAVQFRALLTASASGVALGVFDAADPAYNDNYTLSTAVSLPVATIGGQSLGVVDEAASWSRALTGADVLALDALRRVDRLFGGVVVEVAENAIRGLTADKQYDFACSSYGRSLAYRLVEDRLTTLPGETIQDAVDAIFAAPGVAGESASTVDGGAVDIPPAGVDPEVADAAASFPAGVMEFDFLPVTECLDNLCELADAFWHVDQWGRVAIQQSGLVRRSRTISTKRDIESSSITGNDDELRTRQVVIGGAVFSREIVERFHGEKGTPGQSDHEPATAQPPDGQRVEWLLEYAPTRDDLVSVRLIDASGIPSGQPGRTEYQYGPDYNWSTRERWEIDGRILRSIFVTPQAEDEIEITYSTNVTARAVATSSNTAEHGLITKLEIDDTLLTQEAADRRALELLKRNETIKRTVELVLLPGRQSGLQPGDGVVLRGFSGVADNLVWLTMQVEEAIDNTAGGRLKSVVTATLVSGREQPPGSNRFSDSLPQSPLKARRTTHAPTRFDRM